MLLGAVSIMVLSLTSCKKDKYGMVKIKGGELSQPLIELLALKIDNPREDATESSPVFSLEVSDFYISKYEVTQELYQKVMSGIPDANPTPSYFNDSPAEGEQQLKRPVERITWYDAISFCNKLSELEDLTPVYKISDVLRYSKDNAIKHATVTADYSRNGYRLPTHAEWLYAANGGEKSKAEYKYSGSNELADYAWADDNAEDMTHQVGLKKPNELGLYDMTGNVCEWCQDWYGAYTNLSITNPTGPVSGSERVCRGGGWSTDGLDCCSSIRCSFMPDYSYSDLGLRLVLSE